MEKLVDRLTCAESKQTPAADNSGNILRVCYEIAAFERKELIATYGAAYPMPSLLSSLAKPDCARLGNQWDRCGAYFVEPIDQSKGS